MMFQYLSYCLWFLLSLIQKKLKFHYCTIAIIWSVITLSKKSNDFVIVKNFIKSEKKLKFWTKNSSLKTQLFSNFQICNNQSSSSLMLPDFHLIVSFNLYSFLKNFINDYLKTFYTSLSWTQVIRFCFLLLSLKC